jgi:XRE family transcriptional regulator, regulator of sulfur utilization
MMNSSEIDPRFVGQNVQRLREQHGWSQKELAQHADISQSQVSLIERGEGNPTLESVNKLAIALGVAAIFLLMGLALMALAEDQSGKKQAK